MRRRLAAELEQPGLTRRRIGPKPEGNIFPASDDYHSLSELEIYDQG
jgi:hypothetical protein